MHIVNGYFFLKIQPPAGNLFRVPQETKGCPCFLSSEKDFYYYVRILYIKANKRQKYNFLNSFNHTLIFISAVLNEISTGSEGVYKGNKPSTFLISSR